VVFAEQQSLESSEPVQGARQHRVGVALPPHDPFGAAYEKRRVAPDPMAKRLPHSAQRLRIHEANQDAVSVLFACGTDPLG